MLPVVVVQSLFVAFLWGATTSLQKYTLATLHPMVVFVGGTLFYAPCMLLYALYNRHTLLKNFDKITPKLWLIIAGTSIVGGFCANLLYFYILKKHNSAIVSALTYASPIFVLLLSMIFLQEPIHPIAVTGIMITVFGVAMISYAGHLTHEDLDMH
jgi:drug/metabolite transporter (DMT)-like permease